MTNDHCLRCNKIPKTAQHASTECILYKNMSANWVRYWQISGRCTGVLLENVDVCCIESWVVGWIDGHGIP